MESGWIEGLQCCCCTHVGAMLGVTLNEVNFECIQAF